MKNFFRVNEYKILLFRLVLVYFFYFLARVLFYIFNADFLGVDSVTEFFRLSYYGLAFDTTAILYVNSLFVLLSIIPLKNNTNKKYQTFLFYLYFSTNLIAYVTNFIDFVYYRFNFSRSTLGSLDVLEHESNKGQMFFRFMFAYWYLYVLFIVIAIVWIYLYKKITMNKVTYPLSKASYYSSSVIGIIVIITLMVGGIRGGDFKKSTRPINMVDSSRHVSNPKQADLVLNTPFAIIRTISVKSYKKVDFHISDEKINKLFAPIKNYPVDSVTTNKPNVVLIITESFGREYLGAFNENLKIKNYKSYTPFLDSLANHSLIFTNAYANGSKSIHGMSSVLAGIPSFTDAFTSSSYVNQNIESLVSCLKSTGYDTSFFHGAPNGSMGFLGFSNILGIEHYYGMTEYDNDNDFDGTWGIWDEPFMQFMKQKFDAKKAPFFSTIFTVSSHDPFVVPEKYKGKFPKGNVPIHECVGYTDYSFKKFFESAKKMPWFENTIFVITADHPSQIYYEDVYNKMLNRSTVPILIYSPDEKFKGVSNELAQQIDIYPTVLDMVGYNKPFRSWGRSLVRKNNRIEPFVMNYSGVQYQFQRGDYICTFNGKNAIGFYNINDKGFEHNLIANRTPEMDEVELACKAFLQDYYERIVDKKLGVIQ